MSLLFCSVFSGAFSAEASFFPQPITAGRQDKGMILYLSFIFIYFYKTDAYWLCLSLISGAFR
jgi:hypothetical protein